MRNASTFLCLALALPGTASPATDTQEASIPGDVLMVQGAPGVIHFQSDPDHVKYSWLVGVEWQRPSQWLAGYAYFNNSFGQKSHYLYGGKSWKLGGVNSHWYFKLTAGLVEGYRSPYEDKMPINHNGIGPAIIPAFGYRHERFNVQTNVIGIRGIMFTVGYELYRR